MRPAIPHVFAVLVATAASAPHAATATPAQGTFELRLNNQQMVLAPSGPLGFTVISPEQGRDTTFISFGGGLGYFVSDNFELGAMFNFTSLDNGLFEQSGPTIQPFLRAYAMLLPRLGAFGEGTFLFQRISSDGESSVQTLGFGADLGLEFFLADSWAIRLGPSFRHLSLEGDGGGEASANVFGLNYGIGAYF